MLQTFINNENVQHISCRCHMTRIEQLWMDEAIILCFELAMSENKVEKSKGSGERRPELLFSKDSLKVIKEELRRERRTIIERK